MDCWSACQSLGFSIAHTYNSRCPPANIATLTSGCGAACYSSAEQRVRLPGGQPKLECIALGHAGDGLEGY